MIAHCLSSGAPPSKCCLQINTKTYSCPSKQRMWLYWQHHLTESLDMSCPIQLVFFMPSLQNKSFPVAFSNCGTIQTPQLKTEVALPSLQSACLGFTWLVWVARCFFPAECATQAIRILDMVMVFKVSRSICKFRYSNHLPRHLQRKSGSTKTLENTSLP